MLESVERIDFITTYITTYENKIKTLNSNGLFDAAKLFELFAQNVCESYFKIKFKNLNTEKSNYPCVDLISINNQIFCQVSTCKDIPHKIRETLIKISESKDEKIKEIKKIYFFVLNNESVEKVKDFYGDNRIGSIDFHKDEQLITTAKIIKKAKDNLDFQLLLYELLKKESEFCENDFLKYEVAIKESKKLLLDNFNDRISGKYHIDLNDQIQKIDVKNKKFVFVVGEAGSGKSVLCRKILEEEKNVLFVRAERIAIFNNIDDIWNFDILKILSFIKEDVYIYIDALEYVSDNIVKLDLLKILFERMKDIDNVHIIASCRSSEETAFSFLVSQYEVFVYEIKKISFEQLTKIVENFPSLKILINKREYQVLLFNPFYLDKISQIEDLDSIKNISGLRNYLWNEKICLGNSSYGKIITKIVLDRATNYRLSSSSSEYDTSVISELVKNDVLLQDKKTKKIRLKYDIFEDICFEQYIDKIFDDVKGDYYNFFKQLEDLGRCVYRRYQIWVENKLFAKETRDKFLYNLLFKSLPVKWRQQTEIGIVKSYHCCDFFEENELEIIQKGLIHEFISLTNLYGFTINYSKFPLNMILKKSGFGRRCLVNLLADHLILCDSNDNKKEIRKLLIDFSNESNIDQKLGNNACSILIYILKKYEQISSTNEKYYLYHSIKECVGALYKLNKYCNLWVREFLGLVEQDFNSNDSNVREFSDNAIKDLIFESNIHLVCAYNGEIYRLIEMFYFGKIKKNKFSFYYEDKKRHNNYGLNENGDTYYQGINIERVQLSVFYNLFRLKYFETLEWVVNLVNKSIDCCKKRGKVSTYEIYFSDLENKKNYFGTSEMWLIGERNLSAPTFFDDLLYIAKLVTFEIFNETKNMQFTEKIKKIIIDKANNIMCLSILSNFGLRTEKELPGYCIDFISNIDLVLMDMSKKLFTNESLIRNRFEEVICEKIGVPSLIGKRYEKNFVSEDLLDYARNFQLSGSNSAEEKCYRIFDYLYSITKNEGDEAIKYLQIQKMDFRNASIDQFDNGPSFIIPSISGEAKKITEAQEKENQKLYNIRSKISIVYQHLKNNQKDLEEIDSCIADIIKLKKGQYFIYFVEDMLALICTTLSKCSMKLEKRDEYCNLLLDYIDNKQNIFLSNEKYTIFFVLFSQINKSVSLKTKKRIKEFMLNKLIAANSMMEYDLIAINCIQNFLKKNKNFSNIFITTILKLAEDEMNHQKYNYEYLKKYRQNTKFVFEPNLQPRLSGIDRYIEEDGRKQYSSKKNEIIKRYLRDENTYDFENFDIEEYDLKILSTIFNCGVDLKNPLIKEIVEQYINLFIRLCNRKKDYSIYDIVDWYEIHFLICFLQENIKSIDTADYVISILFDKKDYSIFTSDTLKFYIEITSSLTASYFNCHEDIEKRNIESIIKKLETRFDLIQIEKVKHALSSSLILGLGKYNFQSDKSELKAKYSYKDKIFLNELFSKYGYLNFDEMMRALFNLKYSELLPEILISINVSFKKYIEENILNNNMSNNTFAIINEIVFYSFAEFEKEIKRDFDLIEAFENILLILIEKYQDSKAAILLDEFRIH